MENKELVIWMIINNIAIISALYLMNKQIKGVLEIINMIVLVISGEGELKLIKREEENG